MKLFTKNILVFFLNKKLLVTTLLFLITYALTIAQCPMCKASVESSQRANGKSVGMGLNYGIFRYSNVYGPRQYQSAESGVISIFCNNIQNEKSHIVFGDGEQTRDFIYVEDVAKAIYNYCNSDFNNQILNLSSNTSITINQLISNINKISKIHLPIIYKEPRANEIIHSKLDNSILLSLILNTNFTTFEKGLNNILNYE